MVRNQLPTHTAVQRLTINVCSSVSHEEYLRKAAPYVEGGYNDIDPGLNPALQDHYRITPSPGGPGDQYGTFGIETGGGHARFFLPSRLDFSHLFVRFILWEYILSFFLSLSLSLSLSFFFSLSKTERALRSALT